MAELTPAGSQETYQGSVTTHDVDANGNVTKKPAMNKATTSQKLAKVMASNFPLDTMLRELSSGHTKSDKYQFPSVYERGKMVKLASVSSTTPLTAVTDTVQLTLQDGFIHCLSVDADLMIPHFNVATLGAKAVYTSAKAMRPLVVNILAIDRPAKKITVCGVNGIIPVDDTTNFKNGLEFYRMASAKDQDAAMSDDPMSTPVYDYNYVQRNLCTISENCFQALQEKEIEYGMAEFKEQGIIDFRYQAEITSIFGSSAVDEFVDPISNKRKLHMRGLLSFPIQNIVRAEGTSVENYINAMMEKVFANNNGSDRRILLYGPGFATAMANEGAFSKQLEAGKTEVKWGIKWNVIETNHGTLLAKPHASLGIVGYGDTAIVVDPANIRRVPQIELTEQELDLKKAGVRNSKDVVLEEAWTLEVTNPQTHAFLQL